MKRLLAILFLVASVCTESAMAQTLNVPVATIDSTNVLIGEQVHVQLELWHTLGDSITWPAIGRQLTEFVEVVERSKIDTTFDDEDVMVRKFSQELTLTAFDTGYFAVPPFVFGIEGKRVQTEAFLLHFAGIELDSIPVLADIKPPIDVPFSMGEWLESNWYYLVAAILVAILAWFGFRWYKNREKRAALAAAAPVKKLAAHLIALQKLDELQQKKLWQSGDAKAFHSELTDIFREYLEQRYKIHALEQTTAEIMRGLRTVPIREDLKEQLHQLLQLSDLVKFAKEQPIASENEQAIENIRQFVRMTIPAKEPSQNGAS